MADGEVRSPWRLADSRETAPLRLVTLSMLADRDYLALARTCAMHIAAVLEFPLGRVTDLRLAVNEACLCFLDTGGPRAGQPEQGPEIPGDWPTPETVEIAFDLLPGQLHVTVRAATPAGWPHVDETGWALLCALVGDIRVDAHEGLGALTLIEPLPTPVG